MIGIDQEGGVDGGGRELDVVDGSEVGGDVGDFELAGFFC